MGSNKLPYFPFYADDYLNDHAVMAMDADTEGCYIRLLARSWCNSTPGMIPEPLVNEMCGLHRVDQDRWGLVFKQLSAAFDLDSRPGNWVQRRMVAEYRNLTERLKARKRGADMTNAAKELTRSAYAQRALSVTVSGRRPAEEVEVEVEESKSKHLLADARRPRPAKRKSDPTEPPGFVRFYSAYPKKVARPPALRAWSRGGCEAKVDQILAGLDLHLPTWTEPKFIPYPASFLNQRRWEDKPDGAESRSWDQLFPNRRDIR